MLQRASRLLDALLPSGRGIAPALRFSTELVHGFALFELVAIGLFSLTELVWGTPALGLVYSVAWVPLVLILIWLRRGAAPGHAGTALLIVLFTVATMTNVLTGGRAIGANIALPTVLLFAVLMSSPRGAMLWTALVVLEIVLVSQLRRSNATFPIVPNAQWVASAVDRVPLFFSLASVLIAVIMRRALAHFQSTLEAARDQAGDTAERFTDFAELAADGFWETDSVLRLTYVSRSFAQAMGLSIDQMLGRTPEEAYRLRFPQAPDLSPYMAPLRQRGPFADQVLQLRDPTGRPRWLRNEGRPYYRDNGAFGGYRGVVQDITAQRNAELALQANERRLRGITENVPAIIAYLDHEVRYQFCNALVGRALSLDLSSVLGHTMRDVRGEAIYSRLAGHVDSALRGEPVTFEGEGEYEGRHRFFQTSYVPDAGTDGTVRGFYAITFDITDVKETQLQLAEISNQLKLITDNMPALISYIDADGVFRFNNSAYEKWLGRPLSEITGHAVAEVYDAPTLAQIQPWLVRALAGQTVTYELEPMPPRARHVRVNYIPDHAADGSVRGIFGLIQDISELKRVEQQLRTLAEVDTLTGLPNRNRFQPRLAEAIARSERNDDTLAVMFLDIDRFKGINDTLGHAAGDAVLREFARRLTQCVRQTDTVTRLAGDEFVIVLEGIRDPTEVPGVADKIIAAMVLAFELEGQMRVLSTSIGVVIRERGELDGEALLRRADEALYAAKAAGRGRYQLSASRTP